MKSIIILNIKMIILMVYFKNIDQIEERKEVKQ